MSQPANSYDVFLSHNSQDKPQVRALADWFKKNGVTYFLDEKDLEPGDFVTDALGKAMENSKSAIICIGPYGEGPWHKLEMDSLLSRSIRLARVKNEFRLIPVLLPDANTAKLQWFLETRLWCDLSKGVADSSTELVRLKRAILGEKPGVAIDSDPSFNPYQGLKAFDQETACFFFGRDKESAQLATLLRDWRFCCVTGASGTGKSSLARAGLATDASKTILPDIGDWHLLTVKPGHDLTRSIVDQLFVHLPVDQRAVAASAAEDRILSKPNTPAEAWADGLLKELSTRFADDDKPGIILIDQFEEIFTHRGLQNISEEERSKSIKRILDGLAIIRNAEQKRWHLLLTLRSDFKYHCQISETFWQLLTKKVSELDVSHLALELDELDEEGWREAIKSPATRAGAYLEAGLVEAMLKDVYRQRGSMPLLQLALLELWKLRDGACLTHSGYKQIGGVAHALQQKAERTLSLLKQEDPDYFEIARNLFLRLTSPGEGVSDTRRRVGRSELQWEGVDPRKVEKVIAELSSTENRLIVADDHSLEVTHEVLIRDCSTIRGWIELARSEIPILRRLTHASRRWQENDHIDIFLNPADPPKELKHWITHKTLFLTIAEQEYWRKSRNHRAEMHRESRKKEMELRLVQEQRTIDALKAKKRLTSISSVAISFAIVAACSAIWAFVQRETALLQTQYFKKARDESTRNLAISYIEAASTEFDRKNPNLGMFKLWQAYDVARSLPAIDPIRRSPRTLLGGCCLGIPLLHADQISSIAFSPDGKSILTGSIDNTARLWDARSCNPLCAPLQHQQPVHKVAFSPDGQTVLTAGLDKAVRLWDSKSGKLLHEFLHPLSNGHVVAFSPDGRTILTGSGDGTARLWNASSGKQLYEPLQHRGRFIGNVNAVSFSPDGDTLLTSCNDGTACLWDAKSGKALFEPLQHQGPVKIAKFSPDGQMVLTGSEDKTVRLWNAKTGKLLYEPLRHKEIVRTAAFSPDSQTILMGSNDNSVSLWNAKTGKILHQLLEHQGPVLVASYSPNGLTFLTGSADRTVILWDSRTGKPKHKLIHQGVIRAALFSPDGQTILTGSQDKTARLWDTKTGEPLYQLIQHQGPVLNVAFSPVDQIVITGSRDSSAQLWDSNTGKPLHNALQHQGPVNVAVFSPDGQTVLTGSQDKTVRLWNVKTGKPLHQPLQHQDRVKAAVFSPDGQLILTGSFDKSAQLWDVKTGKPLHDPLYHSAEVETVAFSPDGQTVLTGSRDKTARLWDANTGKALFQPLQNQGEVNSVAFTPDGQMLLTSYGRNGIRLWNAKTGQLLNELLRDQRHYNLHTTAISPNGKAILTGSEDSTARLWDVNTGKPLQEPMNHQGIVYQVAFSNDGQILLTGSGDKTARLWDANTGKQIQEPLQHNDHVLAVAFNSNGQTLVTGCFDNNARIWHVPPPSADEPERLRLSIEVRTGFYLDSDGVRRELTQESWLRRRKKLDELGGFCDIRDWNQVSEEERRSLRTPPK